MAVERLALTYAECRDRFRAAAAMAGARLTSHPIEACGPAGELLEIDIARVGAVSPTRVLVVVSGVHGVEAPIGSAVQTAALSGGLGDVRSDMAIVFVHVMNPWGLAHGRRQNEHNVDLNRNWRRNDRRADTNEAYVELHALACPDVGELPDPAVILRESGRWVKQHGIEWVVDGITRGQYTHPDGLHFGGDRTEASCEILDQEIGGGFGDRLQAGLVLDLHTGEGAYGDLTFLSHEPEGSSQDAFLRHAFGPVRAAGGADGTPFRPKSGQIAAGLAAALAPATVFATTLEFGTADDLAQLSATYQEQWVHRRGDLDDAEHRAARDRYRRCFTPDDVAWEQGALADGSEQVRRAIRAVAELPLT